MKDEFLPWSQTQHAAHPRTHERYKVSARRLGAFFRKLPLDAISTAHVEKFKLSRSEEISSAGTNRDIAMLRFMLNFAVRQDHISRNPVHGVKMLPEGPGSLRVVSYQEEKRYLAAANPLLRDVATLILETGMRPEEVFTIRMENVHLDKRYLFVPIGKTRFARRNVPLTAAAIRLLRRRLRKARGKYLFWHKSDRDKPLTTVQEAHENAIAEAKSDPSFRLYDLRHTFGTRSAMAGVDLATLKELVGHSQISVTMRDVHPTPEHRREAMDKLERLNVAQVFAAYEKRAGSPQESPQ